MRIDIKKTTLAASLGKLLPIIAVLVFVAVGLPLFFLLIQPEVSVYLPGGSRDLDATRQIIQSRREYLSDLRKLVALYDVYGKGDAALIKRVLPSEKNIPEVFAFYERLAKRMGIGLQSIDIVSQDASAKGLSGVKEMSISLRFTAVDYQKFKELLKLFESSSRVTEILSFDIQPESRNATLLIKTYYMP